MLVIDVVRGGGVTSRSESLKGDEALPDGFVARAEAKWIDLEITCRAGR